MKTVKTTAGLPAFLFYRPRNRKLLNFSYRKHKKFTLQIICPMQVPIQKYTYVHVCIWIHHVYVRIYIHHVCRIKIPERLFLCVRIQHGGGSRVGVRGCQWRVFNRQLRLYSFATAVATTFVFICNYICIGFCGCAWLSVACMRLQLRFIRLQLLGNYLCIHLQLHLYWLATACALIGNCICLHV